MRSTWFYVPAVVLMLGALVYKPVVFSQEIATFRQNVRLVEVYATVFDRRGIPVAGLAKDQFLILDDGTPQPVQVFEPSSSSLSCALLLDTTASMTAALPAVKNAATELVGAMRPDDAIAIYSFSESLEELQEFTTDRAAARRALARLRAKGRTALFDAISQLSLNLQSRPGKKAIVVFTDGNDNASVLNLQSAAMRAKKVGVPIFAIAQGDALHENSLLKLLTEMANSTGGQMYRAKNSEDIDKIFAAIAKDLQDAYLLAYRQPEVPPGTPWRAIQVVVQNGEKSVKVRARTGYQPQ